MARNALQTVLQVETDKEQKLAEQFFQAKQYVDTQQKKLSQLQQYRIDYISQIKRSGSAGVDSRRYQQHLSFVGKLDLACEQQSRSVSQATLVADQRKREWINQQHRKQAIEKLIEKQQIKALARQNRIEQAEMDEFATQQYYRRELC